MLYYSMPALAAGFILDLMRGGLKDANLFGRKTVCYR